MELKLIGNMQDYVWQVNDQTWPDVSPIELEYGKTYLFKIRNDTSMSHPINIHRHVFKLEILYWPNSSVTIALKVYKLGKWFIYALSHAFRDDDFYRN